MIVQSSSKNHPDWNENLFGDGWTNMEDFSSSKWAILNVNHDLLKITFFFPFV